MTSRLALLKELNEKRTKGPWAAQFQPPGPCGAMCYRDEIFHATDLNHAPFFEKGRG